MKDYDNNKDTKKIVDAIVSTYDGDSGINFIDVTNLPVREKILENLDFLIEVLFPGYNGKKTVTRENIKYIIGDILCQVRTELAEQIGRRVFGPDPVRVLIQVKIKPGGGIRFNETDGPGINILLLQSSSS